jgi:hypothetical protein
VRPGGHPDAARLSTDRVQAEVVVLAATEQDIGVSFELAFAQHGEAELAQRGFVHPTTCGQVADADADVVDDAGHGGSPYVLPNTRTERASFHRARHPFIRGNEHARVGR